MTAAANLARALGGTRAIGGRWMVCCPCHADSTPSLSIRDGRKGPLLHCFGGCERRKIIAELRRLGIWQRSGPANPDALRRQRDEDLRDVRRRLGFAERLWRESRPAAATVVEGYLRARGLRLPSGVPASLRFWPALRHKPSDSAWPAMIARVEDPRTGEFCGIHRTYIDRDGQRKAPVSPAKMALGPTGRGVVKLGPDSGRLVIGEGIETTLAAAELASAPLTPWAALSAGALEKLRVPRGVAFVLIAADHDQAGIDAARKTARRLSEGNREVRIRAPRTEKHDFADGVAACREHAHA